MAIDLGVAGVPPPRSDAASSTPATHIHAADVRVRPICLKCVNHLIFPRGAPLSQTPQGMFWGLHCAPFVSLLGTFEPLWVTLGSLGAHFGTPGDALGRLGVQWGHLGAALEIWCPRETPSQAEGSQVSRLRTKTDPLEFTCRSHPSVPPVPPVPAKRSTNYSSDPPFHTRRGSG